MEKEAESKAMMSCNDQLDLIRWLIDRSDKLRESVASRAAIVVSANALLLAGTTFLLGQTLSNLGQRSPIERVLLVMCVGVTFLLLVISLVSATSGIINSWTVSRRTFGDDVPEQLFISSFASVEAFSSFKPFKEGFDKTDKEQMVTYALGDLWLIQNIHRRRHQRVEFAIKFMLLAIISFSISMGLLFADFFK